MNRTVRYPTQGISILEILITISLLLVILAVASPSFNRVSAKAELSTAVDQMESSILIARQTARSLNTQVVMRMNNDKRDKQNSISLAFPDLESTPQTVAPPQDTLLPANTTFLKG